MPRNTDCTRCPLHKTTTNVCVWGTGTSGARIMLVGEAPGAQEEKSGEPFTGAAGQVLNEALAAAGLTRADVYIANTTKCRPPSNRTPHVAELTACLPYLDEELQTLRPKVILALGGTALKAFTGKDKVGVARGKIQVSRLDVYGAAVMATYHPAAALYNDGGSKGDVIKGMITDDLRRARALAADVDGTHTKSIALPGADVADAIDALSDAPLLAVDLEWTTGENSDDMIWPWSKRGEAYSVALTGKIDGTYRTLAIGLPASESTHRALQRVLSTTPSVYHNAIADLVWLTSLGFRRIKFSADTMVLGHLVDETQPLDLETVATRYGQVPPGWKGVLYKQRPGNPDEWKRLLEYNGSDTYATLRAWEGMLAHVEALPRDRANAIKRMHKRIMIPAVRALMQATYAGVPIDADALREGLHAATERRNDIAEKLADVISVTPMQAAKLAASPDQIKKFTSASLGLDLPNTEHDTLVDYVEYDAIDLILQWKRESKLISTYLKPWETLLRRQGDGRLHSIYKPTGTRTGRTSAQGEIGGTLHTVPKEKWVRRLVKAIDGRMIVSGDYSQIELKTIAWIANEPTMLALFAERDDLHRATAAFVIAAGELGRVPDFREFWETRKDVWYPKVTPEKRQGAKGANFGLAYGMAWKKFRNYAKYEYGVILSESEAQAMHRAYFGLYSRLEPWHAEIMEYARRTGHVSTPWGRWLTIPEDRPHVAINTPIQSAANDLTMYAMGQMPERMRDAGLRGYIIGNVHDSILLDVHEDDTEATEALLKQTMEGVDTSPFGFSMPFPLIADTKSGRSWGD